MGLSKKKTKTVTNQNTTSTATPVLPDYINKNIESLSNKTAATFAGIDPKTFVAGADPLQTQAAQGAASLAPSGNYGQASDILRGVAGAGPQTLAGVDIAGGIGKFLNPYLKDVVDTSLVNYDEGAGYARAENKLALANDDTFGGSGGAIQTQLSDRGLAEDRGRLSADLRSSAYDKAVQAAIAQAGFDSSRQAGNAGFAETALNRQAGAGTSLVNIGAQQGGDERANIAVQAGLGNDLRGITQGQNQAQIDLLLKEIAAQSGLPLDLFKGVNATGSLNGNETSTTSGAGLTDWLKLAASAAVAASDWRLKRDRYRVGERDGFGIWLFRYLWSEAWHIGVMAQEVLGVKPEAVITMPNGFYAVDYGKL